MNINNRGTKFVNQGKTEIEETYTQTTIENGCFLTVEKFTGLSLVLGDNCYTKIEEFNPQWDTEVSLGANTILTIEEGKFGKTRFKGTAKPSLVKIEEIKEVNQMTSEGAVYYEIKEHEGDKYKQLFPKETARVRVITQEKVVKLLPVRYPIHMSSKTISPWWATMTSTTSYWMSQSITTAVVTTR